MPHIAVKLYPGRSEVLKKALAQELAKAMVLVLGSKPESISIGIEDVAPEDWEESVSKPDVLAKAATIYKRPGANDVG